MAEHYSISGFLSSFSSKNSGSGRLLDRHSRLVDTYWMRIRKNSNVAWETLHSSKLRKDLKIMYC
jgi:hypothetical protein